jgi:hypothetical protein
MSLSEFVLKGVQNWYEVVVKDLTRSSGPSKREEGRWLRALDPPETLDEALDLLQKIRERIQLAEEMGVQEYALFPLRSRVRDLCSAVKCALSRDGVASERLVEDLLESTDSVKGALARSTGYSLTRRCLLPLSGDQERVQL